ncbi:MAG TPA: hypothetical protein DF383_06320, partial [Deltaproteobacteria bacterium]|nr:hypothetical protein [Deltaproteobacteria bacterium]
MLPKNLKKKQLKPSSKLSQKILIATLIQKISFDFGVLLQKYLKMPNPLRLHKVRWHIRGFPPAL